MGCTTSGQAAIAVEQVRPANYNSRTAQHVRAQQIAKAKRKMRVEEEEDSEGDDGSQPKEAAMLGRDLSTFMTESAPRDHQFLFQECSLLKPAWSKRVQREWRILARALPDDIHLRLYGDRMDIMRAMMIGPKNTPYADALLVFDIHLSTNYPLVPPSLKFWSYGERMNPNLYESGLVCLSLLGTWSGSGSEVWCPRKSTVLQVLVSILGLVLVEEPYYLEPGYEKSRGSAQADAHARQYSEKARIMSLRSMLRVSQHPPSGFEEFSRQHFAKSAASIVQRVEELAVPPSGTKSQGPPSSGSKKVDGIDPATASEGFRRELAKLLPSLKGMQQRFSDALPPPPPGGLGPSGKLSTASEKSLESVRSEDQQVPKGSPPTLVATGLLASKRHLPAPMQMEHMDKAKYRGGVADIVRRPNIMAPPLVVGA